MIEPGAGCRITAGGLGMIAHPDAARFEPQIVTNGARATYFGPHPQLDGWHLLIAVGSVPGDDGADRPLFVPAMSSQFTVLA